MFSQINNNKYYSILELNKNATPDEIKKAYKKFAFKYHPDRNIDNKDASEKKFSEINEAYSILSDPVKKKEYDMYGENINNNVSYSSNFGDQFRMFNNIFYKHVSEFVNNKMYNSDNSEPLFNNIKFNVFTTVNKPPEKTPEKPREKTPDNAFIKKCEKPKEQIVNKSFDIKDIYEGVIKEVEINLIRRIKTNENKIIYKNINKKFKIPLKGREIFIENWGNHVNGYKKPADLLIIVNDLPNEKFKRFGNYNLFIIHYIKINELPKENLLIIELPNEKKIDVNVNIIELLKDTNKLIKIENKGFPYIIDNEVKRGSLYIKVEIIVDNIQEIPDINQSDIKYNNLVKMFDVF